MQIRWRFSDCAANLKPWVTIVCSCNSTVVPHHCLAHWSWFMWVLVSLHWRLHVQWQSMCMSHASEWALRATIWTCAQQSFTSCMSWSAHLGLKTRQQFFPARHSLWLLSMQQPHLFFEAANWSIFHIHKCSIFQPICICCPLGPNDFAWKVLLAQDWDHPCCKSAHLPVECILFFPGIEYRSQELLCLATAWMPWNCHIQKHLFTNRIAAVSPLLNMHALGILCHVHQSGFCCRRRLQWIYGCTQVKQQNQIHYFTQSFAWGQQ